MLKIAVFAPIPMASESTAARVNAGAAARTRRACRRSCIRIFMPKVAASTAVLHVSPSPNRALPRHL